VATTAGSLVSLRVQGSAGGSVLEVGDLDVAHGEDLRHGLLRGARCAAVADAGVVERGERGGDALGAEVVAVVGGGAAPVEAGAPQGIGHLVRGEQPVADG
jgi:hypothetical protein